MISGRREFLVLTAGAFLLACTGGCAVKSPSLRDLPKRAVEQSRITLPRSHPFHLKASVFEATNPDNDGYNAQIEEYWVAPNKWRRTVKTAEFSEILITNGYKVSEQLVGDYYPNWLRTVVDAIFDLGAPLQGVDLSKRSDNFVIVGSSEFCPRFTFRAGIPPIGNNVFSTYCFEGALLESIEKPGYSAWYADYKKFRKKQVARKIREYIEPGTEVGARIEELNEWKATEESLFAIKQPNEPLQTVVMSEETLRGLAMRAPNPQWPPIDGGKAVGVLSIYVCVDRQGHVRETYPLNSDNPWMTDAARKQVMNWEFKPATNAGKPVQIESILTFAYTTHIEPKAQGAKPSQIP
jgi:hypothetical protein